MTNTERILLSIKLDRDSIFKAQRTNVIMD